jgi:hypothetical protein
MVPSYVVSRTTAALKYEVLSESDRPRAVSAVRNELRYASPRGFCEAHDGVSGDRVEDLMGQQLSMLQDLT